MSLGHSTPYEVQDYKRATSVTRREAMLPQILTDGLQFPEGPVWAPDGTVYVTEIEGGRITAVAPDGAKRTFADTGGAPNGAAPGPGGSLYVTNNGGRGTGYIQRVDTRGQGERLYQTWEGDP